MFFDVKCWYDKYGNASFFVFLMFFGYFLLYEIISFLKINDTQFIIDSSIFR